MTWNEYCDPISESPKMPTKVRIAKWLREYLQWTIIPKIEHSIPCPWTKNCKACDNCGRCQYHGKPCQH
jgi:hypothetical protein